MLKRIQRRKSQGEASGTKVVAATNEEGGCQAATNGMEIACKLVRMAMSVHKAIQDCDSEEDKYKEGAYREEGAQAQAMVCDQEALLIIEEGEARILRQVVHLPKGQSVVSRSSLNWTF